jgi:AcrR family transcriptional regulator
MKAEATHRAPARGTRPSNRRALTLAAAARLFYRDGYANVGMSDIAREVNVGASALYRHFSSKSELLVAAIRSELAPYADVLSDARDSTDLPAVVRQLADCALDHRQLGVLWQREARNLDAADLRMLREELRDTTGLLADLIATSRPEITREGADLLAWCAVGGLVSVGFHALSLPRDRYVDLLVSMTSTVIALDLDGHGAPDEGATNSVAAVSSRRDDLVSEATELFAERGFGAVGVDEIADAVGIAGPSIYSHFASKQTILVEAMDRGNDVLRADAVTALETESPAEVTLGRLIESYVRLATGNRFLLRVILSEQNQLDPADRERTRNQQREYIDTWVTLFREFTDADPVSARIRVQAVLIVVNDAVQTPHLRSRPGFEHTLRQVAGALLLLP